MTGDGATIVDAAHIEGWAATQNDEIENGLALSKNAHWMFDAGLWSADENLRVVVNSRAFTEHGPETFRLGSFAGRHLQFDPTARLRPAAEYLRQHRGLFHRGYEFDFWRRRWCNLLPRLVSR